MIESALETSIVLPPPIAIIKELRETLEQTGQQAQLKKQMENAEAMQNIFRHIPNPIYIF
jgi:hypothetical protein